MNRERIKKLGTNPPNGNDAYAILGTIFDWIEENENREPLIAAEILGLLRDLGFCVCTTKYGCVVCGGRSKGVGRNQFENNYTPEDEEPKTVPLKLGVGGPIIGTATIGEDGIAIGEITDENFKRHLNPHGAMLSFGVPKISQQQDEMDVPYGRPPE